MPAKHKSPTCKIVRSLSLGSVAHRAAVSRCPECDAEWEMNDAAKTATALLLDTVHGKHGSVAVVSECPKCFTKSWLHYAFSWFADYHDCFSAEVKAAANREQDARHLAGLHAFGDSLCVKCRHLRGLECDTHAWVKCTLGKDDKSKLPPGRTFYYQSGHPQMECEHFTQR